MVKARTTGCRVTVVRPGICCELKATKRTDASQAQREAADTSKHGKDNALGQHLPKQPSLAGAERRADRELAISARRPHQQQVGDVGARDQKDQQDEQPAGSRAACEGRRRAASRIGTLKPPKPLVLAKA